ncbi:MAG: hypothetical protein ABL923_04900 [Burkholderiaceae bacterium]
MPALISIFAATQIPQAIFNLKDRTMPKSEKPSKPTLVSMEKRQAAPPSPKPI